MTHLPYPPPPVVPYGDDGAGGGLGYRGADLWDSNLKV